MLKYACNLTHYSKVLIQVWRSGPLVGKGNLKTAERWRVEGCVGGGKVVGKEYHVACLVLKRFDNLHLAIINMWKMGRCQRWRGGMFCAGVGVGFGVQVAILLDSTLIIRVLKPLPISKICLHFRLHYSYHRQCKKSLTSKQSLTPWHK